MENNIYNFKALEFSGKERSLEDFAGKVVLIVNTASGCYFRKQFKTLEQLYGKFKDQGFEILAFPSNDFNNQEPRTGLNLETYCKIKERVTFPVFKRIHVKGDYIHPLYNFLSKKELNGVLDSKPLWNFHKFLVDREGRVVDFYYSLTSPMSARVQRRIRDLLDAK
ncbi:glutathione peroxidase [Sphingobacterium yanglingense]|uniref:Glutathione peroxidase n=1 Tax=Sphingobacterium yanglingense TaxID=1437280 RepID=A0A4R6WHI5_9SPHI|nr:glutathione peroxidase [Sphingobacterium yanglingense]TDQ77260.1 glutathione peroxidase [Sphingobacterium yanglingense]